LNYIEGLAKVPWITDCNGTKSNNTKPKMSDNICKII